MAYRWGFLIASLHLVCDWIIGLHITDIYGLYHYIWIISGYVDYIRICGAFYSLLYNETAERINTLC